MGLPRKSFNEVFGLNQDSASKIWRASISPAIGLWTVCVLAAIFALVRWFGIFGPPALRFILPLGFMVMTVTPWMLLGKEGRRRIGLKRPARFGSLGTAFLLGAAAAIVCFALGIALFDHTRDNWFLTIADTYRKTMDTTGFSKILLHLVFTAPALIFSPFGEEIFFRGVFQQSLEGRLGGKGGTVVECAVFGIIHLCHHGILKTATGLTILPLSGAIWMVLMFCTGFLFAGIRKRSDSLWPAILSHMAFNLAMNWIIFSLLW